MRPAEPTKTEIAAPGSIQESIARLAIWARRAHRGLARVEYESEFSRMRVVEGLRSALSDESVPVHEIELPTGKTPSELVRFLTDSLSERDPGVVSLSGFSAAFPNDETLENALRPLNFNRENIAEFPLRQIWWMSSLFVDAFIRAAPDLSSWFIVRHRVTEVVSPPTESRPIMEGREGAPVSLEDARARARYLLDRFEKGVETGVPPLELLRDTAMPAVRALLDAGAIREAGDSYAGIEKRLSGASPGFFNDLAQRAEGSEAASVLTDIANLFRHQGRYAEAEPLYVRALGINEKVLGPEHPDTARSLNNLAELWQSQGRYAEAEPLYRRALAIREKTLGPEHPNTAASFNNLAGLWRSQGRYAEAEPPFRRALEIHQKALGPEHPTTAGSLNNLALLYDNQGRYAEAEPLYVRALEIYEKALGAEHPNTAASLNNLAGLYESQGRYAEAEPLYRRALEIKERALGPEHPDVAVVAGNLAATLHKLNRHAEAAELEARARAIREKRAARERGAQEQPVNSQIKP